MKQKIREELSDLAKQLIDNQKTFKTASAKELVKEVYEKLIVLEYLENAIGSDTKPPETNSMGSKTFREENWFTEPEVVPQPDHKEDIIEPLMEKIKDIVAQMPEESERIDELLDEMLPKNDDTEIAETRETPSQKFATNDLEEFAANYQQMPEFEKKQMEIFPESIEVEVKEASKTITDTKKKSLNDSVNKGLNIGLNDRLAFIKHLFEGQSEDFTRVLSQINTMSNYDEAQSFIKRQVKPDYNNWQNKDEYSDRFMIIIEKRFN